MTRIVVAVGGNALQPSAGAAGEGEQLAGARATAFPLVELVAAGCRLVVTHGNGPQVGAALLRSELAAPQVPPLRYDACVASTQGEIGYHLQHALWQALAARGLQATAVSLVTQVRVDRHDPAFSRPTKPVGPVCSAARAEELRRAYGHLFAPVPGGFRRVVPSPEPREIVELPAIRACLDAGLLVVAAGGGGVPVFGGDDLPEGVEAVIDKDDTSALLAVALPADLFAIVTTVEQVFLDHGTPRARPLDRLSVAEARRLLEQGQFPEGSMGPKIRAAAAFAEARGCAAVVTDAAHLLRAVEGLSGTRIVPPASRSSASLTPRGGPA